MRVRDLQAWYYLLGGVWPLVHFRSFEAVTGPKPDRFQTEVAGVLFAAAGAALLRADRTQQGEQVARLLAATSAAGTALLDWRYRKDLRPLFRLEAALEVGFVVNALARRPGATRGHRAIAPTSWRPSGTPG